MNKKGMSTIVGTLLIVLLTIIGVGILWAVASRTTDDAIEGQSPDCFTLNLEPLNCGYAFNGCHRIDNGYPSVPYIYLYIANNLAWGTVRRNEGDGELESVKMVFNTLPNGEKISTSATDYSVPVLRYNFKKDLSGLREHETIDVATSQLNLIPTELSIASIVKGNIICPVNDKTVICVGLSHSYDPQNGLVNIDYLGLGPSCP